MSERAVAHSYTDLVREYPKLAKVVCSSAWLISLAGKTASPDEILENFQTQYPPAGDDLPRCCCAACKFIALKGRDKSICIDCECSQIELAFLQHLGSLDGVSWLEPSAAGHNSQDEIWSRWWHGPPRFTTTFHAMNSNPWNLIDGLGGEKTGLGQWDERSPVDMNDVFESSESIEKATRTQFEHKRQAVERACDSLGVSSPQSRCFDPVPQATLAGLPSAVAEAIEEVAERWNRRCVKDVRRVTNEFRKACQPLGEFKVTTARTQSRQLNCRRINLRYAGKSYCLLRYHREIEARSVAASSGRAPGCQLTMLSESEEQLQKEIDEYRARIAKCVRDEPRPYREFRAITPSARRFSRPNPFWRAVEDDWSVLHSFVGRRKQEQRRKVGSYQ